MVVYLELKCSCWNKLVLLHLQYVEKYCKAWRMCTCHVRIDSLQWGYTAPTLVVDQLHNLGFRTSFHGWLSSTEWIRFAPTNDYTYATISAIISYSLASIATISVTMRPIRKRAIVVRQKCRSHGSTREPNDVCLHSTLMPWTRRSSLRCRDYEITATAYTRLSSQPKPLCMRITWLKSTWTYPLIWSDVISINFASFSTPKSSLSPAGNN